MSIFSTFLFKVSVDCCNYSANIKKIKRMTENRCGKISEPSFMFDVRGSMLLESDFRRKKK